MWRIEKEVKRGFTIILLLQIDTYEIRQWDRVSLPVGQSCRSLSFRRVRAWPCPSWRRYQACSTSSTRRCFAASRCACWWKAQRLDTRQALLNQVVQVWSSLFHKNLVFLVCSVLTAQCSVLTWVALEIGLEAQSCSDLEIRSAGELNIWRKFSWTYF